MTVLVPDVVLDRDGLRRGLAVVLDGERIGAVIPADAAPPGAIHLRDTALLPGFVNGHSHAFQRDIRGVVERVDPRFPEESFWTWREAMYAAAARLDPDSMRDVARRAFRQMRKAGFTVVGEFHYVQHHPDGTWYRDPNAMAQAVCDAAEAEGLRIVLLLVAYERGGHERPLADGQLRFADPSVEAYLGRLDALRTWAAERPLVTVGAAPHSMRACSRGWLEAIGAYCRTHGLPLHIHADEQPREIEESLAEHGLRPVELLHAAGVLGANATIVHGTHCDAREIGLLAETASTVCVCPTTEGNLGDGYVPAKALLDAGVRMTIGSDANVRIDPLEEARELELVARRTALRRNVLVRPGEDGPTPVLLDVLWDWGARSLGLPAPRIAAGAPADLVAIDLDHDEIAGIPDEHLAAGIVFAGSAGLVTRTWVAGI